MLNKKYEQYCKELHGYNLEINNQTIPNIAEFNSLKQNIRTNLLPTFENITVSALELKKLPSLKLENIIKGIVYKKNNLHKKINDKNFYQQNIIAFSHTINNILKTTDNQNISEACIIEHINLLRNLFFQSCVFIQDIFSYKKIPFFPTHNMTLHNPLYIMSNELHRLLYGNHFPLAAGKTLTFSSIPTLRIMIEIKIKYALGIIGLQNIQDNSFIPIQLSRIFDTLDDYIKNKKVIFSIDYSCLKNIYEWTNIYIHSGFNLYTWYPFIFEEYLRPFFNGGNITNNYNMKAGIIIKRMALAEIRAKLEECIIKPNITNKNKTHNHYKLKIFNDESILESVLID